MSGKEVNALVEELRYGAECGCDADLIERAADAIEALNHLVDLNTERCEALRKQLRESHENYEKHLNELEAQLPKQGEWKATEMYMTDECTACGFLMNWEDVPECLFNLPHFKDRCPNCGAYMRKMEVQE